MKIFRIAILSMAMIVSGNISTFAFEQDNQSMRASSASAKFSDPDNNTPMTVHVYMNNNNSQNNGDMDQSSVHYEYDPQNGTYIPAAGRQQ